MELQKTPFQIEIINRIKEIRVKMGYSQMQLANLLDLSNGQIGNIESIKFSHKYTLAQIYSICKQFKVPIQSVFLPDIKEPSINDIIEKIIDYDK